METKLKITENYNHTIYASFIGYIVQAIINNFAPLLFLTFQKEYNVSLDKISLLITFNFGVQLMIDLLSAKFIDKIGYKISIVVAHIFAAVGLISLSILPTILSNPFGGLVVAVMLYAIGGGLTEVLVSPIVEACPTKRKEAAMSLLHSFYSWGQAAVILLSTAFFVVIGISNWRILTIIWAIVPLLNGIYYAIVPIETLNKEEEGISIRQLMKNRVFWLMVMLMICAGACEQAVSQWASAFAEAGLGVSKAIGDLAGPCAFALLMGSARVFYAKFSSKIELQKFMMISGGLCLISYLITSLSPYKVMGLIGCALCGLSVGIMWPGTFSISSLNIKGGGTAMFALLALAGDLGCSLGPTFVGFMSETLNNDLKKGILAAIVFPIMLIGGLLILKNTQEKNCKTFKNNL
ncbi:MULTISPECIES: MFS transporter [Clostridium]|uniref:MFS transporter n=1 Tax=Clostridium cibarium TaxID=2762247 RepID=A0ABR8PUN2_9CLOT|nr:MULTISPECIES: MFS transporter [Clostridium]MBD7911883.1 MFS transporter [Clostridium cibarium]